MRLELQYLYEIKRLKDKPDVILLDLAEKIALKICNHNFNDIISASLTITWTRDPFDRIITANALLNNNILLSKDENILNNYLYAKWRD